MFWFIYWVFVPITYFIWRYAIKKASSDDGEEWTNKVRLIFIGVSIFLLSTLVHSYSWALWSQGNGSMIATVLRKLNGKLCTK